MSYRRRAGRENARQDFPLSLSTVARLRDAWLAGQALFDRRNLPTTANKWDSGMEADMPEEQRTVVRHCIHYVGKAWQSAARGEYEAAIQLFAIARLHGRDPRLDEERRVYCLSEMEAAEAYLEYVCGNMAGARMRLLASMSADEALEERFGHEKLHIHRVHLANNLVKVEARSGNLRLALTLAANILDYVHGEAAAIDLPTQWGTRWTADLRQEARGFLTRQTTAEVACALAGLCNEETRAAWRSCFAPRSLAGSERACSELAAWYRQKDAFLACAGGGEAALEAFGERVAEFLLRGPEKATPLLWRLAALDVALLCARSTLSEAADLRMEIGRGLRKAATLPRHVREVVSRFAPQEAEPALAASAYR